jgi:transglutaminase superfamily protein
VLISAEKNIHLMLRLFGTYKLLCFCREKSGLAKGRDMTDKNVSRVNIVFVVIAVAAMAVIFLNSNNEKQEEKRASRTFEINYTFTVTDLPGEANSLRVWVPVPPSNKQQKLVSTSVPGELSFREVEDNEYGNKFLIFDFNDEVGVKTAMAGVPIKFKVIRYAVNPINNMPQKLPVDKAQLARFLAPDRLIPIKGKLAEEARETVEDLSEPLDKARALYDNVVTSVVYDKSGDGWGRGDAVYACDIRKGNCTDFHSLFIGQARSQSIPARFIMGLPLPENKSEGTISGYHCWGEFYVDGKGWLPIDASEAHNHPEKQEELFGRLDENRVAFTVGRDIVLPESNAGPLNYAIYAYAEVDGKKHIAVETDFAFKDSNSKKE